MRPCTDSVQLDGVISHAVLEHRLNLLDIIDADCRVSREDTTRSAASPGCN